MQENNILEILYAFFEGRGQVLNAFKNRIFLLSSIEGLGFEILIPKKLLQKLPIALAKVKAGNTLNHKFFVSSKTNY